MLLTSCQFTEEITLNKDGSGIYKLNMDMSTMMGAMKGMNQNDSIKKENEKIDTTLFMRDLIEQNKDSISKLSKEQQASLEAIKDLKMHISLDEEKGIMLYDFILDFNNLSELDNISKKIEKAQNFQGNKSEEKPNVENYRVEYLYENNHFSRKVIMIQLNPEEQEMFDKKIEEGKMIMEGSNYKLVYHFPYKIKNVNYKAAQFSEDHKTLMIEVPMDSLIKNPQLLDLKVDF
jgi:hypothetical protein